MRTEAFYQQMAGMAAETQDKSFQDGWNAAMEQVMMYDKPWTDPEGAPRPRSVAVIPNISAGKPTATVTVTERAKRLPPGPTEGRTYVAGPMSNVGPPTWNYPAFNTMATRLRHRGYDVVSPAELHAADPNVPWDWYLREDLAQLAKCTRVVFLPGWASSRGASLEHQVAKSLGMELVFPEDFEEWFSAR